MTSVFFGMQNLKLIQLKFFENYEGYNLDEIKFLENLSNSFFVMAGGGQSLFNYFYMFP